MKFSCTRDNLSKALDLVSGVVSRNPNLPILKNILLEVKDSKVKLTCTNLEITVTSTFRAKVEEQGEFTVPAKTLTDYINLLSEEKVNIELDENELDVTCGTSSTKIKGEDPEEYPVIPEVDEEYTYSILAEPFREALRKTEVAVAKNEIRPELSGVYFGFFKDDFDGLKMAATDSYRLAEKKISVAQGEDGMECIIPADTIKEMARLISSASSSGESQVRISFSGNQMIMRYGNFELSSRLVEGDYPDYAQIIPESFSTEASFPVEVIVQKIRAASLFTTAGVNSVKLEVEPDSGLINVLSDSTQKGKHEDQIDANVKGEENSILLNHQYVLDGLQHMSDEVEFLMNDKNSPCLFKEKGSQDYRYIVMPIRE
jgi:DNA polymerase-3 subunit beta